MKVAFFTESNFTGKTPRDFNNSRVEYCWYIALNADHYPIWKIHELGDKQYDLGIVIIPKTNIEQLRQYPLIGQMKRTCQKISSMQEGPVVGFQDWAVEHQFWYYNILIEMDVLFAHNERDLLYYKGLIGKENVFVNPTLLIENTIADLPEVERKGVLMGGNFVSWYGGFDDYIIAQEFNEPIYCVSMGRKQPQEDQIEDITYLPYLQWTDWMRELNRFKYAVHLMPTHAAGTFALNCAYFGIPCIGYYGTDTQQNCHPDLTVNEGDLYRVRLKASKLKNDQEFYQKCSKEAKYFYNLLYSEQIYLDHWKQIENKIYESN